MNDIEIFARALFVLAVPFLFGIAVGVEIVKRRKEQVASLEAELGRDINRIVESTTEPLRFTGSGVRCTREITVTRNGTKCKITFEAQS